MGRCQKCGKGCSSSISMAMKAAKLISDKKKAKTLEALQGAGSTPVIKEVSDTFSDASPAEDSFPRNPLQKFLFYAVPMLSSLHSLFLISASPEKRRICGLWIGF